MSVLEQLFKQNDFTISYKDGARNIILRIFGQT